MPNKTNSNLFGLWDLIKFYNLKISEIEEKEQLHDIDEAHIELFNMKLKAIELIENDLVQINKYDSDVQLEYLKLHGDLEDIILSNIMNELNERKKED